MQKCPFHPEYEGIDAPFTNCATCLYAWVTRASEAFLRAEDNIATRDAEKINAV